MPRAPISDLTHAIKFIETADPMLVAEFRKYAATVYARRGLTPKLARKAKPGTVRFSDAVDYDLVIGPANE